MAPTSLNPDQCLDRDGTTPAYVVEQLVIVAHYAAGHGPQLGAPRPPIDACEVQPCPTWRRHLASRLP